MKTKDLATRLVIAAALADLADDPTGYARLILGLAHATDTDAREIAALIAETRWGVDEVVTPTDGQSSGTKPR